ncbi:MAG TPA: DUF433 domain-containing protein [Myxococcota bacterium]|nr:DUF433 domain-containing protein [Myxococcota bacterium]
MSIPAEAKAYPHIVVVAAVSGGQPIVEGTRIPVSAIVRAHQLGMDFDEILIQYPGLKPEQLHAALAYYLDHKADFEASLKESDNPPPGATEATV